MRRWLTGAGLLAVLGIGGVGLHWTPARAQTRGPAWLTSLTAAEARARETGRPLAVVFRCEQSQDGRALDAELYRPQDPELRQLLEGFVPVWVTNFRGVDLNRYRFDYDLTLAVLLMDAGGGTYTRWGTRDATSATDRISIAGLRSAMRTVLARHGKPEAGAVPPLGPRRTVEGSYPAWTRTSRSKERCYHCHYANNARFYQLRADGAFTKAALLMHPLPETLGLTLAVERNQEVQSVRPGSPAAKAGVRAGDLLVAAGGLPVLTSADLQLALDSVADPGQITLHRERGGQPLPPVTLDLPAGWRRMDISWRPSQDGIAPQLGFGGKALAAAEKRELGLPVEGLCIRVTFLYPGAEWATSYGELRPGDVLYALNGESTPALTMRGFHRQFRLRFNPGDPVVLNVLREGKRVEVPVTAMEIPQSP